MSDVIVRAGLLIQSVKKRLWQGILQVWIVVMFTHKFVLILTPRERLMHRYTTKTKEMQQSLLKVNGRRLRRLLMN
jgi:hypothetical protein